MIAILWVFCISFHHANRLLSMQKKQQNMSNNVFCHEIKWFFSKQKQKRSESFLVTCRTEMIWMKAMKFYWPMLVARVLKLRDKQADRCIKTASNIPSA